MSTSTTTLADQLAEFKTNFKQRVALDRVAMVEAATAALRATGIESRALQVGQSLPHITLPDATGGLINLADLWQQGPLVVVFYRGG
ncbi:MAG: hypothetical protein HEQ39_01355 [Rhizobacter sp.]